jgi:manganese transport protein
MLTVLLLGNQATGQLLVLSQVVLSLQLPFAVLPLVWFCGRPELMGDLKVPPWLELLAWACAALIVVINSALLLSLAGLGPS